MRRQQQANDTYAICQAILRRGNEPGLIAEWFDGMKAWAEANNGPDASALRTWLGIVKPRSFYTALELSMLWPALKVTLGLRTRMEEPPAPNRLSNELQFHGLPLLKNDNGTMYFFHGGNRSPDKFFIVEHVHKWKPIALTQKEFDDIWFGEAG